MALIVLTSACGSPGVTTTALGLALTWPRPVLLVEADPTGGSPIFAGYFRGESTPPGGLIDLAMAHRHGCLADALPRSVVPIPDSMVQVLPGTRAHGQARSLVSLWEPLAAELRALERNGQDVIVDAGRLGLAGSPEPLIHGADMTLLVMRSTVPAIAGASSWASTLRGDFENSGAAANLGVLMVGAGDPFVPREVSKVLRLPVLGSLASDEPSARVFALGEKPKKRWDSAPLVRSLRATGGSISAAIATNSVDLAVAGGQ